LTELAARESYIATVSDQWKFRREERITSAAPAYHFGFRQLATMQDIDVLIVGGGPTGTMLALELALHKVSFRIIDKEPARSDKSRALILQPRSLELMNRHGIVGELTKLGTTGVGARVFINKKLAADIDLDDLGFDDTAFPLPLWISQAETEHLLDNALKSHGHEVERPMTAEKVEQDDTGVNVTLRGPNNTEEQMRCKYVVGCDGAHSVVRHAANLTFEGAPYPQDFILADLHLKWDYPGDRLTMMMGQGILVMFPMKDGLVRLIAGRPRAIEDKEPTLADFQDFFSKMAPGTGELYDPVWISRFRLHHRGVNKYQAGRLFVAGDAAHIHSPAGGQGMNTGIQDAVNLGWKLARVIRGQKGKAFLESYDAERRPIGEKLLKGTDRIFGYGSSTNALFIFLRNTLVPWVLPWYVSNRSRRAAMFRFISEFGIRYRQSPIVGTSSSFHGPVQGGDRAPDGRIHGPEGQRFLLELCTGVDHHLILFSGTGADTAGSEELQRITLNFADSNPDSAKVLQIYSTGSVGESGYLDVEGHLHNRYGFTKPGYVLIRPDLYVAHIGPLTAMDEFVGWLGT
jgi:2-polyprenyl-6-methoxyphenol hydroxylase-like FAD-dependent oxidoreductase